MKHLYLFVLFVMVCAVEAKKFPSGWTINPCPFGESYYDGCNSCFCDGSGYMCTQRYCPPDTLDPPLELHQICTPFDTKMKDCNTCQCDESGNMWICTEMACPTATSVPIPEPTTIPTAGSSNNEKSSV